jgi:hypothetical protein
VDLERLSVRLRPRNAWEALDLGFALGREHAKRAYGAWLAVFVPAAVLALALFREQPAWGWLLLWWLKPLFERAVLQVYAADIFGDRPRIRGIVRGLPRLAWRSGILGALTVRRFDLARSLHLPVFVLERLSGREARRRNQVLDRDARGAAVWLTAMLGLVDVLLAIGGSLAIAFLVDVQTPIETILGGWMRGRFEHGVDTLYGAICASASMTLVEPFYVACGFTLYLQRRTALEGWDIELRFRQLAARVEGARRPAASAGACVLLALALGLAGALAAPAARAEPDPGREIGKVLADPQFGHEAKASVLRYVGPRMKPGEEKKSDLSWLQALAEMLANGARAAAWAAAIIAVLVILYYGARYARLKGLGSGPRERPQFLFGLDVRPESLPRDVPGAARAAIDAGRIREALSLLYRASLVRLMDEGLEFLQGDTEGDCMRAVKRAGEGARVRYFAQLVEAWQLIAYAHRSLAREAALALADGWDSAFAIRDGEAGEARP